MTQGRTILTIAGLLALLVALPLTLRQDTTQAPSSDARRLIILTPHGESIRREFAEAFAKHWQKNHNQAVYIDWRYPGGTSEIRMVLDAAYKAAEEE
jgi:ABC-type sulfate transport system substrate-binding protein